MTEESSDSGGGENRREHEAFRTSSIRTCETLSP